MLGYWINKVKESIKQKQGAQALDKWYLLVDNTTGKVLATSFNRDLLLRNKRYLWNKGFKDTDIISRRLAR